MAAPRATTAWGGRKAQEARRWLARQTTWPTVCAVCGDLVYSEDDWELGHILARELRPDLTWEPSNWRVEHGRCSASGGHAVAAAKRAAVQPSLFPGAPSSRTELRPPSLSPGTPDEPMTIRAELTWNRDYLARFDWLLPLLDVPDDAAVPLMMSPVPEDAVGTYGWDAVEWIERTQRITLRWWQKLSLVRQYEHRADGSLCFHEIDESASRRSGKSVGMRGGTLWRMEHGEALFGEPTTVIHTGSDMAICREIQKGAWRWAEAHWGDKSVTKGNGKEAIESPTGARWLVRAQDAVYGYDCGYGIVDEAWDVKPDTVTEGLEPASMERLSPQIKLTSTAHRRATSLMRTRLADAMTGNDPGVLLLLWGAPLGADSSDPAVWRAASPYWSDARAKIIAKKYEAAVAGESDPEFDDPDPMRGFEAQYLNMWRIAEPVREGNPIVSEIDWASMYSQTPARLPDGVAVESWYGEGITVAAAWATTAEPIVTATSHPDLAAAVDHVKELKPHRAILVGATLATDPAWKAAKIRTESKTTPARTAVADLTRRLADGILHTGSDELTTQVLQLRISPGTDGPRIRSTGRLDAVKAALWATAEGVAHPRRKPTIPSRYKKSTS